MPGGAWCGRRWLEPAANTCVGKCMIPRATNIHAGKKKQLDGWDVYT